MSGVVGEQRKMIRSTLKRVPGLAQAYRAARRLLRHGSSMGDRTAAFWGHAAVNREGGEYAREWLSCPQVLRESVFPRLGGLDWFGFLREKCRPLPRENCLSLCCGDGSVERHLVKMGICRACEGVDISPAAIAVCRQEAESAGLSTLTYRVVDVERARLPATSYDLVIGWMALHHIQNLSQLFHQVKRALRPGGLFVVNEYVGPARFQLPEAQVAMIDEWVRRLPARLQVASNGQIRDGWTRPNVEDMIRIDPSEAVRSDQILPELEREFVIVERVDYGGGLLQWVLHDITQNLDPENAEDVSWLRRLCTAEQGLMKQGILASDFCLVIARPASR